MKFYCALALIYSAAMSSKAADAFVLPHNAAAPARAVTELSLFRKLLNKIKKGGTSSKRGRGDGYGPPLDNISEAVGNTPMIKLSERMCPPGRTIYAKAEYFNPLSSVKDRLALSIIEEAERQGKLKPGDTVIEATSGNTGSEYANVKETR